MSRKQIKKSFFLFVCASFKLNNKVLQSFSLHCTHRYVTKSFKGDGLQNRNIVTPVN